MLHPLLHSKVDVSDPAVVDNEPEAPESHEAVRYAAESQFKKWESIQGCLLLSNVIVSFAQDVYPTLPAPAESWQRDLLPSNVDALADELGEAINQLENPIFLVYDPVLDGPLPLPAEIDICEGWGNSALAKLSPTALVLPRRAYNFTVINGQTRLHAMRKLEESGTLRPHEAFWPVQIYSKAKLEAIPAIAADLAGNFEKNQRIYTAPEAFCQLWRLYRHKVNTPFRACAGWEDVKNQAEPPMVGTLVALASNSPNVQKGRTGTQKIRGFLHTLDDDLAWTLYYLFQYPDTVMLKPETMLTISRYSGKTALLGMLQQSLLQRWIIYGFPGRAAFDRKDASLHLSHDALYSASTARQNGDLLRKLALLAETEPAQIKLSHLRKCQTEEDLRNIRATLDRIAPGVRGPETEESTKELCAILASSSSAAEADPLYPPVVYHSVILWGEKDAGAGAGVIARKLASMQHVSLFQLIISQALEQPVPAHADIIALISERVKKVSYIQDHHISSAWFSDLIASSLDGRLPGAESTVSQLLEDPAVIELLEPLAIILPFLKDYPVPDYGAFKADQESPSIDTRTHLTCSPLNPTQPPYLPTIGSSVHNPIILDPVEQQEYVKSYTPAISRLLADMLAKLPEYASVEARADMISLMSEAVLEEILRETTAHVNTGIDRHLNITC